jgi:hypothetical protein
LEQRLVKTGGRLMKHARSYWLLLAAAHWCPGKASLASSGSSEVARMKKVQKRSGSRPVTCAAQIAKVKIRDENHWAGQLNFTCAIFSEFGIWAQFTYWTYSQSFIVRGGDK